MPLADLPQSNKMHAVPQNIMDVEFKLIGDLTLRQFIYLFVFGGSAYFTSVAVVGIFKWPTVIFFAVIGVGLAFVPIQERGLDEWIVNFVKSVYAPTQRIWRREPTLPSAFLYENLAVVRQELITLAPTSSRRRLEEYLEYHLVDTEVDPLDIPEREYMLKVRNAYGDRSQSSGVGVSVLEPEVSPVVIADYPASAPFEPEQPPVEQTSEQPVQPPEQMSADKSNVALAVAPNLQPEKIENKQDSAPAMHVEQKPIVQKSAGVLPAKPQPPREKPHDKLRLRRPSSLSPMTPDMHSGRRFINLVPTSGELVLPIRGERVIRSSAEIEIDEDIQGKAEKLQQLLAQIKTETGVGVTPAPQQAAQPQAQPVRQQQAMVSNDAASLAQKLQGEQDRLSAEISNLEHQKDGLRNDDEVRRKDDMIQRLKTEKERTQVDYEALQRQILDLQNKLKQQSVAPAIEPKAPLGPSTISQSLAPTQTAGKPNILFGSVRKNDGTTKENVLLIVKNQKGEAVRAVKTNSLGQFKLTTPLANGVYTVEVASDNTGATFDIISIEVKGGPITPVDIIGK